VRMMPEERNAKLFEALHGLGRGFAQQGQLKSDLLPLFIPLQVDDRLSQTGLWVFILGILVYFVTWLPLILSPDSGWSTSAVGLLAPRLTPLLPFLGIAVIGHNWPYGGHFQPIHPFLHLAWDTEFKAQCLKRLSTLSAIP
jgi:hypothetical protein